MNRNQIRLILLSILLVGSSTMCSIISPANFQIGEPEKKTTIDSLKLTVSVLENQVVIPTIEPTTQVSFPTMVKPPTGSITGTFTFPSEDKPRLRIVAINIRTGEYIANEVLDGNNYKIDGLPVGKYHLLAYLAEDTGRTSSPVGGYSQYVICGLLAGCTDHSLVDVEVTADLETAKINIMDWDAPAGLFPADPTK